VGPEVHPPAGLIRARAVVASIALALGVALPGTAVAQERSADGWFLLGETRYEAGDHAGAAEAFERAYRLRPDPKVLFAWAQAEKFGGNCDTAIPLYHAVLEAGLERHQEEAVREAMVGCEAVTPHLAPEARTLTPATRRSGRESPWYHDPPGAALGIGGALCLGASMLLWSSARTSESAARSAPDYESYVDLAASAQSRRIAASAVAVAGVAAAGASALRYRRVRRNLRGLDPEVAIWSDGGGIGAAVSGSF
jgi:tetratricopeptide (TPR) repeat protein